MKGALEHGACGVEDVCALGLIREVLCEDERAEHGAGGGERLFTGEGVFVFGCEVQVEGGEEFLKDVVEGILNGWGLSGAFTGERGEELTGGMFALL